MRLAADCQIKKPTSVLTRKKGGSQSRHPLKNNAGLELRSNPQLNLPWRVSEPTGVRVCHGPE
jgi:hypothetical protein